MRIYKYEVPLPGHVVTIEMPQGARILRADMQFESPMLWALVDPSTEMETVGLVWWPTGPDVGDNPGEHVGTFLFHEGRIVMHLFRVRR